jgi:basic membrane protein A and related proteins
MIVGMMRKTAWIGTALVTLAALVMVAGGGAAGASTQHPSAAKKFLACLVTDTGGINDRSFNQLTWLGLQAAAAAEPRRITALYLESTTASDYAPNIDSFIAEGCGIIVTVGFLMANATEAAAKANPHVHFAIVDCTYRAQCLTGKHLKNLDQLAFNVVQDAFLGGYLAAAESKTHAVATYGGENFGTVTIYMDGFWDGVQYYNSNHHTQVKVLGWSEKTQKGDFAGSFTDPSAGATIAKTFISEGADVIFPVAGGTNLGTASAVRAADAKGKKVSIEWDDVDGCFEDPQYCKFFLTSVTKGIAAEVKVTVLAAFRGKHASLTIGTLKNAGVALAPYHDFAGQVPARLKAEISKLKAEIESGKIVPATKSPV